MRHGAGGLMHALGQSLRRVVATACIGKDEQRVLVEAPVGAQVTQQRRRQRDGAILAALARTDAQLVLAADDIMDGQVQTLRTKWAIPDSKSFRILSSNHPKE